MTDDLVALVESAPVDKLRSSAETMREYVQAVAAYDPGNWVGPIDRVLTSLVDVARVDLCLARLVEGHVDAMRILDEAGTDPRPGVYGVWASRSAGTRVAATKTGPDARSSTDASGQAAAQWQLHGTVRFASGVDVIDRALLPVWTDKDHHVLLDVESSAGRPDRDSWHTGAMDASRSFDVYLDTSCPSSAQVGAVNFYLDRSGFVVGGLRVAAVWVGGLHQLVDLTSQTLAAFDPSDHQLRRLGVVQQAAWTAHSLLHQTADGLDGHEPAGAARQIALTRSGVVMACDLAVTEIPLIIGPAGLSRNARLARTLADLGIYVRQHHLDRELAALGAQVLAGKAPGSGSGNRAGVLGS